MTWNQVFDVTELVVSETYRRATSPRWGSAGSGTPCIGCGSAGSARTVPRRNICTCRREACCAWRIPATIRREKHVYNETSGNIYTYIYRPQRSWGEVIFSQASVILSTDGVSAPEGCLLPRGVCSGWCLVPGGGVWSQGGVWSRVSVLLGGCLVEIPLGRLLLRAVCILLECILVLKSFTTEISNHVWNKDYKRVKNHLGGSLASI